MKLLKIDHVGIVVRDLQEALATYERNFGLKADPSRGGEVPALGIRNAFVPVGESDLEFIQPTTDQGPVAEFARERGEGQFLLSLAVDDLQAAVQHLRALGYRVSDPNNGIAFVSPRATHGVNLQLVQRG
ncbi:MAG: VOC family protein [Chloroflexota bacterium]|nr:VOC family protein [Dehalococcoidia bacterium]MDW8047612.1 VOC family protein [Chloroflexota bacterium]